MRAQPPVALAPLEVLYDAAAGAEVRLPPRLAELYGRLAFPESSGRPHVTANFVQTVDGVVSLGIEGQAGGGPISGFNEHDRFLVGLLRALADVVLTGAGTLRSVPKHLWTAEYIYPAMKEEYRRLRADLGRAEYPLNVIVTASGHLDGDFAVLRQSTVPVLIVTTAAGERNLTRAARMSAKVAIASRDGELTGRQIVDAVRHEAGESPFIVSEAGPLLMGLLLSEHLVDDLFLTVAPQLAGRDGPGRPGLVSHRLFAPEEPLWGTLSSIRRAGSHLFLRYALPASGA